VLRRSDSLVRAHGLGLGGLTEDRPLDPRRLARDGLHALGWALLLAAVIFPLFWLGYRAYWQARGDFVLRIPPDWWDIVLGQLLVVALPEEAFYRGYLQTALERGWASRRWRILGAELGRGSLVCAAIFALGHYLALPHPNRLAVFFPALVFAWLRARTGGIGAALGFHALCNLLTDTLARGYHQGP
jgi:membrane protease YdiL (CAAX protease family)